MRLKRPPTQGGPDRGHVIISNHKIRSVCMYMFVHVPMRRRIRPRSSPRGISARKYMYLNAAVNIKNLNGAKEIYIHINLSC